MNILFTITIFLTSLLLTKLFFSKKPKKNNHHPPSPPSLPFLGHLHLLKPPLHRALARLSARYGPVLLLRFGARRVLLVSSHSLAEECFTKNDLAFATRPRLASSELLTFNYTTLAAAPYGPHWRNVRRIATVELLSTARLNLLCEVRLEETRSLVYNLFRECGCGGYEELKRVELKSRLFGLALNVIMRMIAGKSEGEGRCEPLHVKDDDEVVDDNKAVDSLTMARRARRCDEDENDDGG